MKRNSTIVFYAVVAAFGALVVGMNLGGISGAIDIIEREFALSALGKGFVASALMVGCLFGALLGGGLSDRYGRRLMLVVSACLLGISAAGCSLLMPTATSLVIFRLVGGIGVGVLSAVIPIYISEISPARLRGTFVSLYQLFVVVGILAAYCANYAFAGLVGDWRYMLGLPLVFAVLDVLLLTLLPESPRWLIQRNRIDDARRAIDRFGIDSADAEAMMEAGRAATEKSARFSELFKGTTLKIVLLGSMLAAFQQITGINVVISYAPSILGSVGIADSDPLLQTVFVGAANLVFTVIALWVCDKFGRKTLLLWGCFGLVVSLGYLAYAFSVPEPNDTGILVAILAYIAFFALSLSPLMFVVTAEIYPSYIRGTAMALSTGISWVCAFLVVQFYPWIENTLGADTAFGIFAVLSLAAGLFIKFFIPETKGRSLEEIEAYFYRK